MNTLIIAEKPSVANRIAAALGGSAAKRKESPDGIGYYEITTKEGATYIAAAVGHLFTIRQSGKERGYPVLNVEWAPSHEVGKKSDHTKAYLDTLKNIANKCQKFVNACDFDIEGTVIGTNIIKELNSGKLKDNVTRMKFSTTTEEDIKESYEHQMPLDINNFSAGEARHMLDWLWGINLSRALTYAVHGGSTREMLSIGRVQGPSLAILAERENEITKFVSKPFWRIFMNAHEVEFANTKGDIFDKSVATKAFKETEAHKQDAVVEEVELREQQVHPYPPFDLTALQLEASRTLRYDPSVTLSVAQSLYEKGYTSYPRTSSQKLPASLGLPKIISALAKNPQYSDIAGKLVSKKRFKPLEGAKEDAAHPAIFPTGVLPGAMSQYEAKLYDMIVRRFLACFAEHATVARARVVVVVGSEKYSANGSRIVTPGWLEYYTYAKIDERMLPDFKKGAKVNVSKVEMKDLETQPPKRYTKAGLISELEKRDIGTKATRAQIIDTLFRRRYLEGQSNIMVTKFGMSVFDALSKNVSMIVDENTTRKLEEDMEKISAGKMKEEEVIDEGKKMLLEAIAQFDKNKEQLAVSMRKGLKESSIIGKCPKDGGDLVIRRSKMGKQFVACNNYPKCTQTYSLPQGALIIPTGVVCEHCHTPFIKVIRRGMRPFEMDLDSTCITKKNWKSYGENKQRAADKEALEKSAEKPAEETVAAEKPKAKKRAAVKPKAPAKKPAAKRAKKTEEPPMI